MMPKRRTIRDSALYSAVAGVLLAYIFRDAILHGYVLGQADFLLTLVPWQPHRPVGLRVHNPLLGDIPALIYPFLFHAREAVRGGEVPLWASGIGAGQPFLAAYQTAVFSPFTLFDYALPFPQGMTADVAARLYVGGLGMFWFLRSMPLGTGIDGNNLAIAELVGCTRSCYVTKRQLDSTAGPIAESKCVPRASGSEARN